MVVSRKIAHSNADKRFRFDTGRMSWRLWSASRRRSASIECGKRQFGKGAPTYAVAEQSRAAGLLRRCVCSCCNSVRLRLQQHVFTAESCRGRQVMRPTPHELAATLTAAAGVGTLTADCARAQLACRGVGWVSSLLRRQSAHRDGCGNDHGKQQRIDEQQSSRRI